MKTPLLLLLLLLVGGNAEKFLNDVPFYNNDSYFKEKVYTEHDWKSFMQLKEANETVNPDNYDLHLLNAAVFFSTNKLRDQKNMKQFRYSPTLRNAAVVHSYQMVDKKFFDHYNKRNLQLRTPDNRIQLFGTTANAAGENIDYTHILLPSKTTYVQLGELIVDDWFHSPPHKKNMLNKSFGALGCGAFFETKNKEGARYVKATQDFSN